MKILLTGANGYIGKRLLPVLANEGHRIVCCVRDKNRFNPPSSLREYIEIVEVDFLERSSLDQIPADIDGAFYLIHSMSSARDYEKLELQTAVNFRERISATKAKHVVYLGGITNEDTLSKHLASRKAVEEELVKGSYHLTALRAGIIIGSGSGSFEIMRDLVEKLPFMVAPKWLDTKCQPIGIHDVIEFLEKTIFDQRLYDRSFDIGGPDVLTYREMLLTYAKVRKLPRWIFIIPVMTPRLSSYWLYFITSTSYKLAIALVNSMKIEVICRDNEINKILNIAPISYQHALERTFSAIQQNRIISSWKDSLVSGMFKHNISEFLQVPIYGCFIDARSRQVKNAKICLDKIWKIGGQTGWYYATPLWKLRGFIDRVFGGVGLRRGRTHPENISSGDAIDFWRVLLADKKHQRLLLFAEMKLPGEAWLEFKILDGRLHQTATFRPKGIWGRIYWNMLLPFHHVIFSGMINRLVSI